MIKKVVTVMNYPDRINENIMCITWMKKTREHFPKDFKIEILYEKNISNLIKKYAKKFNITLKKADRSHEIDFTGHPDCIKANHNINFKLYNLCKLNDSFVFLDADAFILHSSNELIEASKTKEFIAVNHQNIPGQTDMLREPVLNSGVMVINNTDLFNWNNFKKILFRDKKFVYPGTDQSLINSRFKEDNIDYTHANIGFGWNSWSKYTIWENNKAFCKGLKEEHQVFINHYWNEAKPWRLNCPLYNETFNLVKSDL